MVQLSGDTYSFLEALAPKAEFVKVDETIQPISGSTTVETISTTGMTWLHC